MVENVADRRVHAALRREKPTPVCFADFAKLFAVVEVELRDAVVVGDEKILLPVPRRSARPRPAPSAACRSRLAD